MQTCCVGYIMFLRHHCRLKRRIFLNVDRLKLWNNPLDRFSDVFFCGFCTRLYTILYEPKTIANLDDTSEVCCSRNLAWFLVTSLLLPVVTSRMFSTIMKNLDPSIFGDADSDANANADTDADLDLDANADFELIFLKFISVFLKFNFFKRRYER